MYSVKVQMQSHGDGCQVIIGRCFSRSGLSGGSGNCLGLCCLGSLNRTAYNCTQQFKNEDKDNQQSNTIQTCDQFIANGVIIDSYVLEWNVAVLLERVGQALGLQLLKAADNAGACVARLNNIVNITTVGCLVR